MSEKFPQATWLGSQRGGFANTSGSGFSAVEIITAKGSNVSTSTGARTAQQMTERRNIFRAFKQAPYVAAGHRSA